MKKFLFFVALSFGVCAASKYAPLPAELDGSMMPIDLSKCDTISGVPDSLEAVHISYISRHGARYLSSPKKVTTVEKKLYKAAVEGKLSPEGDSFFTLLKEISKVTGNRWGLLSEVGVEEQQFFGSQMAELYPKLLHKGVARSISTFVPRVVMTMYEFNHSMEIPNQKVELYTASGHQNDSLLYMFDYYPEYKAFRDSGEWVGIYEDFVRKHVSPEPARRLFSMEYDNNTARLRDLTMDIYGVLQGCRAIGLPAPTTQWMTTEEYRSCWLASNLKHYLRNTPNSIDPYCIPATAPLVRRIIADADSALTDSHRSNNHDRCDYPSSKKSDKVRFSGYFGHAETLLPLFSVLQLPGCFAEVSDYDTLSSQWQLQDITPLGANLTIIFMRPKVASSNSSDSSDNSNPSDYSDTSDPIYAAVRLNGRFIEPFPGSGLIVSWPLLRQHWLNLIEKNPLES